MANHESTSVNQFDNTSHMGEGGAEDFLISILLFVKNQNRVLMHMAKKMAFRDEIIVALVKKLVKNDKV